MILQHNLSAMAAQKQLNINSNQKSKLGEKLSTGYKINRAADNSAGLTISEKMRAQIRGLNTASENVQDGISLIQTADGAMSEIHSMLQRIREISIQAYNGTNATKDKEAIQDEINNLISEIDKLATTTEFNTQKILQGIAGQIELYVGDEMPSWLSMPTKLEVNNPLVGSATFQNTDHELVTSNGIESVWTPTLSDNASAVIDFSNIGIPSAVDNLNSLIGKGFYSTCSTCSDQYSICFSTTNFVPDNIYGYPTVININDLIQAATNNTMTNDELAEELVSRISNIANSRYSHFTEYTPNSTNPKQLVIYDWRDGRAPSYSAYGQIINHLTYQKSQSDIILQVGANSNDSLEIVLPKITLQNLRLQYGYNSYYGVVDSTQTITTYPDAEFGYDSNGEYTIINLGDPHTETITTASNGSLDDIDYAINYISRERSRMGSYQNRLEHINSNLLNTSENLQSSESRIRDADIAELMVLFMKHDLIMKSGDSILAQANQQPEFVLRLLE
ncbi:flagellin [Mobilisporobacter senegalensis]|uniref:Flagellin n=1 Tax=Mobilisporobacter senegalensis TaxID=1329262 RepID=A0A3N1XKI8_9FIRM|nr:flagellin [Mobilisporobacter senegalensis]ROR27230.1 flagellin [Mobilisporobacter senegalensis]